MIMLVRPGSTTAVGGGLVVTGGGLCVYRPCVEVCSVRRFDGADEEQSSAWFAVMWYLVRWISGR